MKFLIVVAACLAVSSAATVQPSLLNKVRAGGSHDAILELHSVMDQIESSATLQSLKGDAKVSTMINMLKGLTGAAQAPYATLLSELGVEYEQFWASNIIHMKNIDLATLAKVRDMFKDDALIREQVIVTLDTIVEELDTNITQAVQWGVEKVRAPQAWSVTDGAGIVVGIIDTGANGNHVALKDGFAGAWRDPYYNNANPTDTNGHGSHALGSAVGRANGIGVAPGARWVACRGLNNQGSGTENALITCGQWMLTASPRPDIVTNSWGGGEGDNFYNSVVSSWRNAGIIPVFAIGNAGSACRTANSPGDQGGLLSCGATQSSDAMASFSSRGPSNAGVMKPELSAPGQSIVSCGTGSNNYATLSGTSMATPHLAGAIALVLSANPNYDINQVYTALANTAAQPSLTSADRDCGLEGSGDFPNNAYGYGRIDVGRALGV